MKCKVQVHEEKIKEFIVYELAPNGELCRRVASCRSQEDADRIVALLDGRED